MKRRILANRTIMLAVVCMLLGTATGFAQTTSTDLQRTISYQGMLTTTNRGQIGDGQYEITLSLYTDPSGTTRIWQDTYTTTVTGGIFNIYLGSQGVPLPTSDMLDRQLWIGTRVGNMPEMSPLTPLSASPYALNVSDKSITTTKLSDGAVTAEKVDMDYVSEIRVNGEKISGRGTSLDLRSSDDFMIGYDRESRSVVITAQGTSSTGKSENDLPRTLATPDAWNSQGDLSDGSVQTRTTSGDWIGTTGNGGNGEYDFTIKVHDEQVMKYQHRTDANTPNISGGNGSNAITASSIGSVIGGGGSSTGPNRIE